MATNSNTGSITSTSSTEVVKAPTATAVTKTIDPKEIYLARYSIERCSELEGVPEGMVTLQSKEDPTSAEYRERVIPRKFAYNAALCKESLENDLSAVTLPLQIPGKSLDLIWVYLMHHQGKEDDIIPKPLRSKVMKDVCKDSWDADFIDAVGSNLQDLYDLALHSNYADCRPLLHMVCAKIASLIKGQPLEKIKDCLSVKGPATKSFESTSFIGAAITSYLNGTASSSGSSPVDESKEESKQ